MSNFLFGPLGGPLELYALVSPLAFSPHVWLRFDDQGLADNDPIATAEDLSGNGNDWTQAAAGSRPTFKANILNGHGVARLDGTDDFWSGPDISGLTAAEVFVVIKIDTDPPAADGQTGLWHLGGGGTTNTHFPFTDGVIYDSFATDTRKTTVDPTPSLTSFRLYNVVSTASEWTSFLDGTQLFTTGTNNVQVTSTPTLGRSKDSTYHIDGDIAEFALFDRKLSAGEKAQIETYFANRYALTIA